MNDRGTYDPTEEWSDDRPEQDMLVDDSKRAASDTESRIDGGASDAFADDRAIYDPTQDTSTQTSLTTESVDDGQMDLTGEQATEEPEYLGDESETRVAGGIDADDDMMKLEVEGATYDVPRSGNGWQWTTPKDDPTAGPGHDPTAWARWERGDDVLAIRGRGTNHRLFYWPDGQEDERIGAGIGAVRFGKELRKAKEYIVDGEELPTRDDSSESEPGGDDPDRTGEDNEPVEDKEDNPAGRPKEVRFGRLDAANDWRNDNEQFVHSEDNRAMKTVRIDPDAPEDVLNGAGAAAVTSRKQTKTYGQVELTDEERDQLEDRPGWSWGSHGFHARASKAVLLDEGGTPWLDHYDHEIEPIEHVSVIESSVEMAAEQGLAGPGETGMVDDSETAQAEIAQRLDKAQGEQCRSARDGCEGGFDEACKSLKEDCGWSEAEVKQLIERTEALGEDPTTLYDPAPDVSDAQDDGMGNDGMSFEAWARQNAPSAPDEGDPEPPSDEELAEIAPTPDVDELRPEALRALQKAWTGYRIARSDARDAHDNAEEYARIINGVRAVNGQEPLDFEEIEEWSGGPVLPEDPTEEFPGPTEQKTMEEAAQEGLIDETQGSLDTYDPTGEF